MRQIVYPLFLLSLVGGVYYFFGENFSPFMQKVLLVLAAAFAFFVFRGIFLFFFGWLLKKFSSLFKTLLAGILFLLAAWGIWGILPEAATNNVEEVISRDSGIIKDASTLVKNGVDATGNAISDTAGSVVDGTKNGLNAAGDAISDTAGAVVDGVQDGANATGDAISNTANSAANGVKNGVNATGNMLADGINALDPSDRTPSHLLKNIKKSENSEEKKEKKNEGNAANNTDEKTNQNNSSENSQPNNQWHKPVVAYVNEKENSEKKSQDSSKTNTNLSSENPEISGKDTNETASNTSENSHSSENNSSENTAQNQTGESAAAHQTNTQIAKMKRQGVRLISSGEREEKYTVVFREVDAKVVFPVEYEVSQVIWTDEDASLDRVDFAVATPRDGNANVSITLSNSGATYEKFLEIFVPRENGENQFYVSEKSENSITYVTFFEGILWEISIQKDGENISEDDLYQILLPLSFEKRED